MFQAKTPSLPLTRPGVGNLDILSNGLLSFRYISHKEHVSIVKHAHKCRLLVEGTFSALSFEKSTIYKDFILLTGAPYGARRVCFAHLC